MRGYKQIVDCLTQSQVGFKLVFATDSHVSQSLDCRCDHITYCSKVQKQKTRNWKKEIRQWFDLIKIKIKKIYTYPKNNINFVSK